jgi:hypothetical protein
MKKIVKTLIALDIGLILFSLLSGNHQWLINMQIGFISSSLVMFASIISYRNMVQKRIDMGVAVAEDNRDTIDKIEDSYDLYGEDDPLHEQDKPFKEIVLEEKRKLKQSRRSILQITKDSKAALSLYRLGAYGVLIFGFFYLNNNKFLDIGSYLFSLSLPPVVVVIILMRQNRLTLIDID